MLAKRILPIIFLFSPLFVNSQNIVPNGDFEEYSELPSTYGEWYKCIGWSNVNMDYFAWNNVKGSPDYQHLNGTWEGGLPIGPFTTAYPYSGNAVMGFGIHADCNCREYMAIKLSTNMITGKTYKISFALTSGESNQSYTKGCTGVGFRFSSQPLQQLNIEAIGGSPQVQIASDAWSTVWKVYTFNYRADNNYEYLTIGNFYSNSQTTFFSHGNSASNLDGAYYLIDKIEIEAINEDTVSNNVSGDTIFLEMPNIFSPNGDKINDYFSPTKMQGIKDAQIFIYNRWGQLLFESSDLKKGWDGEFQGQKCTDGTYFWYIQYATNKDELLTLKGFLTLIK